MVAFRGWDEGICESVSARWYYLPVYLRAFRAVSLLPVNIGPISGLET